MWASIKRKLVAGAQRLAQNLAEQNEREETSGHRQLID
jgi:hypothetical protein